MKKDARYNTQTTSFLNKSSILLKYCRKFDFLKKKNNNGRIRNKYNMTAEGGIHYCIQNLLIFPKIDFV